MSRYEIVRRLATGGMAEVLLARDAGGRLVALKRVLPHLAEVEHVVERLRVEARATAALDHPGIVRAIELLEDGPTLVLEHVAGVDARTLRARGRPLSPIVVAAIVAQAAEALAHAHTRGVVHRDLRAANLLIAWDGTVKLADFGIAAIGEDPSPDVTALTHLAARLSDPEGGFLDEMFTAAGLALRLERWLHERGVDDPRVPVAALLTEIFTDDERRDSLTVEDDFGDPTPPLLGR